MELGKCSRGIAEHDTVFAATVEPQFDPNVRIFDQIIIRRRCKPYKATAVRTWSVSWWMRRFKPEMRATNRAIVGFAFRCARRWLHVTTDAGLLRLFRVAAQEVGYDSLVGLG